MRHRVLFPAMPGRSGAAPGRRASLALLGLAATGPAVAQPFPDRGLRIIIPFPPGGAADFLGRTVGRGCRAASASR